MTAVGSSINVFDSCTFCSSRASSRTEGRPVHVRPDVLIGRSFQCGYFLFGWFLCPCPPSHPLPCPYPHPFPTLCCMPVIVFTPHVCNNISPRSDSMGSSSWGPNDSLKRKEAAAAAWPQRRRAPAQLQSSNLHFQSETQGSTDTCMRRAQKKKTMKSILGKTEERKIN